MNGKCSQVFGHIFCQDKEALMKLLTFEAVEKMVVERVEKKTMTFAQEVKLNSSSGNNTNYKVDPSVVAQLYKDWIMPLTKLVEVEYLLRRLN